jgi:hypothetical protein
MIPKKKEEAMNKHTWKKVIFGCLVTGLVLLGQVGQGAAAVVENTYDWHTYTDNSGRTYDTLYDYQTQKLAWTQTLTFDPAAAKINSATLTLTYTSNWQIPYLEFWILSGNNSQKIGNLDTALCSWKDQTFDVYNIIKSFSGTSFTFALKLSENTKDLFCFSHDSIKLDKSVIKVNYSPVPVPSSVLLLGSGLLGLVAAGRRQQR